MKTIMKTTILLSMFMLLFGCLENEKGTYGPAWDTEMNIPLLGVISESAISLFEDNDNFYIPNDTDEDKRIRIQQEFDELEAIEVGEKLTDVELPRSTQKKQLDPLEIENIGDIDLTIPMNSGGIAYTGSISTTPSTIEVAGVSNATFSNSNDGLIPNNLEITVANNISSGSLNDLVINIAGTSTSAITMNPTSGTANIEWSLSGKTIDFTQGLDVSVSADAQDFKGAIEISFGFSTVEITYADGLESSRIATSTFSPDGLTIDGLEAGVEEIEFENGGIDLSITPYDGSGLEFNVTKFNINNLEGQDGEILFPGTNNKLTITDGTIDIALEVEVTTTSGIATITYDTTRDITIESGFMTGTSIAAVTISSDFARFDDASTDIDEEILDDVPGLLNDVDLATDSAISFTLDGIPAGLRIDLSEAEFVAYDKEAVTMSALSVSAIGTQGGIIDDSNPSLNFLDESGSGYNLFTWLQSIEDIEGYKLEDIDSVKLVGVINVGISEGEMATLRNDLLITPSMTIDLPFDLSLNKEYTEYFDPSSFDSIDEKYMKMFEKAEFVISELENSFPLSLNLVIYIGSVPEWNGNDNLEDLSDEELEEKLYNEMNRFLSISLEKNFDGEKRIAISKDDLEKMTGEDLYLGFAATIPVTDLTLTTDDEIVIRNIYTKISLKINQE